MLKPDLTNVDEEIRMVFADHDAEALVFVFGSVAKGRATFDSDLDVAYYGKAPLTSQQKMQLITELGQKTGRPIDLVDLFDLPEPLLGQVLTSGRRLKGSDSAYAALLNRHLVAQADFVPLQNRILVERRVAWIGK